jgi:putative ABC transport system permease protein
MTWLRLAWSKMTALVSSRRLDDDFDEELASHLALAEDEARHRGLDAEAARREALIRLGGLTRAKELHRDTRGAPMLDTLRQDLAYASRTLRKTPVFTLVIVASLALGIGANTAVFTLINAVLLRTLPVHEPEQLVRLAADPVLSYAMSQDLRERQQVFTDILASSREWQVRLAIPPVPGAAGTAAGGDSAGAGVAATVTIDNAPTGFVSANYFNLLGLTPQIGRFLRDDEDRLPQSAESQGSVAILSDGFWARQFGRDPGVLGRIIYVNRSLCRVIGVAPRGFAGESVGQTVDVWVPLVPFSSKSYLTERRAQFTRTVARLKPGVTLDQARRATTQLFHQLLEQQWREHPESHPRDNKPARDHAFTVTAAATGVDGEGLRHTFTTPLYVVMAIVGAVLLIACANVANLLLARAAWRRREFSVRLGLGCSRGRLVRQLLTESLLLASLGAISGLVIAWWGTRVLHAMADAGPLALTPDLRVLAFVVIVTVLTGIGFGIAPALRGSRIDVALALNEQGRRGAGGGPRRRVSRTLVMSQIGLSLMLLIGAGLLVQSLYNLRHIDLGFKPEQVVVFHLAHSWQTKDRPAVARTVDELHQRISEIPGVRSASLSTVLLFSGADWRTRLHIPGYQESANEDMYARFVTVSSNYFETVGMTLLAGRGIEARDTAEAPRVAVVNETLARRYFPDGRALGKTMTQELSLPSGPSQSPPIEIVGIVRDSRFNDPREEVLPLLYVPYQQHPSGLRGIEVRTAEPVAAVTEAVRRAVAEVTPDAMIRSVRTLSDQVDRTIGAERLIANLCVAFGGLALLLAGIGLYGVMAYSVAHRTGEIGIRMALGATRGSVLRLMLTESAPIVIGGALLGLAGAWMASRLIGSFLFGLTPTDATTIVTATLVLLAVSAFAVYVPARRATRVDPMAALRHE